MNDALLGPLQNRFRHGQPIGRERDADPGDEEPGFPSGDARGGRGVWQQHGRDHRSRGPHSRRCRLPFFCAKGSDHWGIGGWRLEVAGSGFRVQE